MNLIKLTSAKEGETTLFINADRITAIREFPGYTYIDSADDWSYSVKESAMKVFELASGTKVIKGEDLKAINERDMKFIRKSL